LASSAAVGLVFSFPIPPAASSSQFLGSPEHIWPFSACLLGVPLCLVLRLLAVAEQLLRLPVEVVLLGLAAVWSLQASQDLPAMGGGAPVMVAAVATSR
jgi:hypothetical protein